MNYVFGGAEVHRDEIADQVWKVLAASRTFVRTVDSGTAPPEFSRRERVERAGLTEEDWRKLALALPGGQVSGLETLSIALLHELLAWTTRTVAAGLFDGKTDGLERRFLLTWEEERKSWEGTDATQRDLVARIRNLQAARDSFNTYLQGYRDGDLGAVLNSSVTSSAERGRYPSAAEPIVDRLRPLLDQGGVFFEASVFQLALDGAVLSRLRSAGYAIERVGLGTPATKPFTFPERNRPQECLDALTALVLRSGQFAAMTDEQRAEARPKIRDAFLLLDWRPQLSQCASLTPQFLDCVKELPQETPEAMQVCFEKGKP